VYEVGAAVLSAVRKEKALAKVSLKVPVDVLVVHDTPGRLAMLALVERDLREAGGIRELRTAEAETFWVEVEIAPPDAA
jgi:hypothetical protein